MKKRTKKWEAEIEKEYTTLVKYECPKRGWVEEEVVVKRFKPKDYQPEPIIFEYSFLEEEKETEE